MLKQFAAGAMAAAFGLAGPAVAQTKWDMPTPYAETNFHTKNTALCSKHTLRMISRLASMAG